MFKQNDILVDKQGNERKVLGVCGEMVFVSCLNQPGAYFGAGTGFDWTSRGFTLKQEKWKLELKDEYFYLDTFGDVCNDHWENLKVDLYRLSIGNIHRTKEEALAYKEKLIKWASENK